MAPSEEPAAEPQPDGRPPRYRARRKPRLPRSPVHPVPASGPRYGLWLLLALTALALAAAALAWAT